MSKRLRVAVIGASGIGRHHARWWHLSGCHVTAFVGTSEASCERTAATMRDYFGFDGTGYADVAEMLAAEKPEVVDVSSPNAFHRAHCEAAFAAGCHVLCEKPLCWDDEKPIDAILEDGRAVRDAAADAGRLLGMSAQYPASIPTYREIYAAARGGWEKPERITMEMDVTGGDNRRSGPPLWADVASHPLSFAIGLCPGSVPDPDTFTCAPGDHAYRASLELKNPDGTRSHVEFLVRDIGAGKPRRRFGVNGLLVDWEGFADDAGIYRARLVHERGAVACDDFLHTLIGRFAAVVKGEHDRLVIDADDALLNLQIQADLLRVAKSA